MKQLKNKILLTFVSIAFFVVSAAFVSPSKVAAAGETYTWKDFRNITVSGGDLKGTSNLTLSDNALTGDQLGVFYGTLLFDKGGNKGCQVNVRLFLYKTNGTNTGKLWNPPPYDSASIGGSDGPPHCYLAGEKDIDPSLHNVWVTINGTRPNDPNGAETDEQKSVYVTLLAPDPKSTAPQTVTISIINGNGQTVATQTAAAVDDVNAQLDVPPEQTPVGYRTTFMIDPGEYKICATYVITDCETFTKEKYDSLTLKYGNQFQMPYQKAITVNVQMHGERPCGSSLTQEPVKIILTKPDGSTVERMTTEKTSTPNANEEGQLCTVNTILGDTIIFEDMPPGDYMVCGTTGECATVTKVDGEPATVVLNLFMDYTPPDEQPVCNAGTGFAGWIAFVLCPVAQIIVDATDFIENNLIIPYLTVSPLSQDSNNGIYKLWESIRNIANILFIIVFFIIIFSQATSVGLSNYGIKRLLPRLILAAIGTNLSYYGVAFMIDMFNVFGAGVADLVMGVISSANLPNADASINDFGDAFFVLSAKGLSAAIIGGGAALAWLGGLLLIMFLIILVAVVVLIIRQMLILGLVIVAPLAIVAALLPNTEKYFTKWYKLLIQLLLMYPLIVLLFAVGKIMAALFSTADYQLASGASGSDTVSDSIKAILSTFAAAFPLIFLPAALLTGGKFVGRIKDDLTKAFSGAVQRGKSAYEKTKFAQFRKDEAAKRARAVSRGTFSLPKNKSKWGYLRHPGSYVESALNRRLNASEKFNAMTGGFGAYRGTVAKSEEKELLQEIQKKFGGDDNLAKAWIQSNGQVGSAAYSGLDAASKIKFNELAGAGYNRTHLSQAAAMNVLTNKGEGNQQLMQQAFTNMQSLNAPQSDLNDLSEEMRDKWRGMGRGDLVGDPTNGGADRYKSFAPAWSEIDARNISRYSFSDPVGKQSFHDYVRTDREGLRSVVAGLDSIKDARAKPLVVKELQTALAGHVSPTTGRVYSRDNLIDELRSEFKLQGY
ncbi:MAG: type IV secretion system protein [Candidatus Woesebacteria bacterium]|jgi:hypothetical protein